MKKVTWEAHAEQWANLPAEKLTMWQLRFVLHRLKAYALEALDSAAVIAARDAEIAACAGCTAQLNRELTALRAELALARAHTPAHDAGAHGAAGSQLDASRAHAPEPAREEPLGRSEDADHHCGERSAAALIIAA